MVAYNGTSSTNPPSGQNGIAHYDFAGNLIDFVFGGPAGVSSAGMYKIHSTGEIFFDDSTQSGGGITGGGLHQLFYDGVPMSIGPQIHPSPYPPISAVNWQGASSYCVEVVPPDPPKPNGWDCEITAYSSTPPFFPPIYSCVQKYFPQVGTFQTEQHCIDSHCGLPTPVTVQCNRCVSSGYCGWRS